MYMKELLSIEKRILEIEDKLKLYHKKILYKSLEERIPVLKFCLELEDEKLELKKQILTMLEKIYIK